MDYTNHNTELRTNKHLSDKERFYIEKRIRANVSIAQIARELGRSRTTIYTELKRGTVDQIKQDKHVNVYYADAGQRVYEETRKESFCRLKLAESNAFLTWAEEMIKGPNKWSIDACVGYAKREGLFPDSQILCTKTLYNYVHEGLFISLWDLPLAISRKNTGHTVRAHKRKLGASIDERDPDVENRAEIGHWEIDTIHGIKSKDEPVVITLAERKTRFNVELMAPTSKAIDVAYAVYQWVQAQPRELVKTITADNGSEFATLAETLQFDCEVYFAHPSSPHERGTNERHNGLLRRFIPKGKAISELPFDVLERAHKWINNLPRKILGYMTPAEAYQLEVSKLVS